MLRNKSVLTLSEVINYLKSNHTELYQLVLGNEYFDNKRENFILQLQDNELSQLADAISANQTLTTIVLNTDKFFYYLEHHTASFQVIAQAIQNHLGINSIEIDISASCPEHLKIKFFNFLYSALSAPNVTQLKIHCFCKDDSFFTMLGLCLQNKETIKHLSINGVSAMESPSNLISLITGIARQKNLQSLELQHINMGDAGLIAFSDVLTKINNLKKLSLDYCLHEGIHSEIEEKLSTGLKNHKQLHELYLSLNCQSLVPIINVLPMMPKLQVLKLKNALFSLSDLKYLGTVWHKNELTISNLFLGDAATNKKLSHRGFLDAMAILLDDNHDLRHLQLEFYSIKVGSLDSQHILINPERCHLQKLELGSSNLLYAKDIARIAKENTNIMYLTTNLYVPNLNSILAAHRKENYKKFLDTALFICMGYCAASQENDWCQLPAELIIHILSILAKEIAGLSAEQAELCNTLILQNLRERRAQQGTNEKSKIQVADWWHHSLFCQGKEIRVFKKPEEKENGLFNLISRVKKSCTLV